MQVAAISLAHEPVRSDDAVAMLRAIPRPPRASDRERIHFRMAATELVRLIRDGDIATLLFDDPDRRNAMTRAMGEAFRDHVSMLARDESLRAVVVSGKRPGLLGGR